MTTAILLPQLLLALSGCGREAADVDVRFAGVGLNPDDIGPEPEPHSGLIEYAWVDFAGGGLNLGFAGLGSFASVGPDLSGFKAPYAMVSSTGYIFQDNVRGADALYGSWSGAPPVEGMCQTAYFPFAFVQNLVDVGDDITFASDDGSVVFKSSRNPAVYPPNPQDVFTIYFGVNSWRSTPFMSFVPIEGATSATEMEPGQLRPANFVHGATVNVDFPGAFPPLEAFVGSIPVPASASGANRELTLPSAPTGVMLAWNGPRYDEYGSVIGEGDNQTACLQWLGRQDGKGNFNEVTVEDCLTLPAFPNDTLDIDGQIYTAPWDTENGQVAFRWQPGDGSIDETVTITVRFLAGLADDDMNIRIPVVRIDATDEANEAWQEAQADGLVPAGLDLPQGYRPALPCDPPESIEYIIDPSLQVADGSMRASLQGDPFTTIAEVTCRVNDEGGEFVLTDEMLADALAAADRYEAGGAVFYMARTSELPLDAPPVRDRFGKKHDTAPVLVSSSAVSIGRFWWNR